MTPSGIFPSRDGPGAALGDTLGFIYDFAGSFVPERTFAAQGQTLRIIQNTALFASWQYVWGDGRSTFALPNLEGAAIIGAGAGPGLYAAGAGRPGRLDHCDTHVLGGPGAASTFRGATL